MIIFQLHLFQFRVRLAGTYLSSSGHKVGPSLDRTSFYHRAHSHPQPHIPRRDNVDTPVHLPGTSLGCGKKLEHLEKPHTDLGKTCKLHTTQGLWLGIDFPPH